MQSRFLNLKSKVTNNTKVIENYFFMTALQVINTFFGIFIYPYLIRVLGASSYGLYVFALSVTNYFGVFITFGFSIPALKLISENKNNTQIKNQVASAVFTSKSILAILSCLIFSLLLFLIPDFKNNKFIFVVVFLQVFNNVIFPGWYFQGIQKMKIVTNIQLSLRILSLPFIFLFVKNKNDLLSYVIIVSATNLVNAFVSFVYLYYKESIRYKWVRFSALKSYYRDSLPFFWTASASVIKEESVNILIGVFFGKKELAYFNLAEKIVSIPRMLAQNINDALFPKMVLNKDKSSIRRVIRYETWIGISFIAFIIIFGRWIVLLLGGNAMLSAYPLAIILSFTILVWLLVGIYTNFIFVPNRKFYFVTQNQFVAFISFFLFCIPALIFFANIYSIVVSLILSGFAEIAFCNYLIKKNKFL